MKTLIWRIIKKSWEVQLAVTLLLASGVAVLAIYGSYMVRETGAMSQRVKNNTPPGFFLLTEAQPRVSRDVSAGPSNRNFRFLAGWYQAVTPTNLGSLPITYVDLTYGDLGLAPLPGVAAVHASVADRFGLSVGDSITLSRPGAPLTLQIVDVFAKTPFNHGIDFGESILVRTGEPQQNKYFLYTKTTSSATDTQVMNSIALWHTRGSVITPAHEDNSIGGLIVRANYAVISQAKLTLMMFLGLAFLTARLLGYLDNRRMLAILKALGLKGSQMAAAVSVESLISPLCGALVGAAGSVAILHVLSSSGHGLNASVSIISTAVLSILPAIALGVFVPARLAQVSTVNELLFERPAAMFRERTTSLRKRNPGLEPLMKQGVHFLRLEVVDGVFEGLIFRELGERVQAGEVLALEQCWWGMKTKEYVSPISGVVVSFERQTGVMGVGLATLLSQ